MVLQHGEPPRGYGCPRPPSPSILGGISTGHMSVPPGLGAEGTAPHSQHSEIGYNYRLSNVLAAIGRGQLRVLDERVRRKREIFEGYRQALGALPGIDFMPEAPWGRHNRWLTVIAIYPEQFWATREDVRLALEAENGPPNPPTLGGTARDRKSTRLNSSHIPLSRMPSSA